MSKIKQEITPKAILLGIFLSMILAAANAYLGLFAGMTVSASIPAAVISMAILKQFRSSNILENNIVQTAASAGESLAAGVIFTLPALVLMGYWENGFNYLEVAKISAIGGIIGVLFTVPLRRALILKSKFFSTSSKFCPPYSSVLCQLSTQWILQFEKYLLKNIAELPSKLPISR